MVLNGVIADRSRYQSEHEVLNLKSTVMIHLLECVPFANGSIHHKVDDFDFEQVLVARIRRMNLVHDMNAPFQNNDLQPV